MTSDQLKDEVTRQIVQSTLPWATNEQRQLLSASITIALRDVTLAKQETALSTEFAEPNEKYVQQFLAIKMVAGLSDKTLNYYRTQIMAFLDRIKKPVPQITSNDIRLYIALKKTQDGSSNVTLNNILRVLKSFFSTLMKEEMIAKDPTAKVATIKVEKTIKEPFSDLEMEEIRKACATAGHRDSTHRRDLALVEVLFSTGCRVGELCMMKKTDIDGDRIKVRGKGNKERFVYLNARAQMALKEYLDGRKDTSKWLFPNLQNVNEHVNRGGVDAEIRKIGRCAGVEKCHPHRFRRTAATTALKRGMPFEQVSKMLGHEELQTTQIYARIADEDVHESHRKYMT